MLQVDNLLLTVWTSLCHFISVLMESILIWFQLYFNILSNHTVLRLEVQMYWISTGEISREYLLFDAAHDCEFVAGFFMWFLSEDVYFKSFNVFLTELNGMGVYHFQVIMFFSLTSHALNSTSERSNIKISNIIVQKYKMV